MAGTHRRLPGSTRRKVGMMSNHHAPYVLGFTHATMAGTEGCETARWSESHKAGLSSDWGLQLDPMKPESLVIADRSEEHTSELQSRGHLVCRLLLEKKKENQTRIYDAGD